MDSNQAHKQAAVQFLQMVVAGQIDEAYQKYVDMRGKHHNAYFAAGFPALEKAMIEDNAKSPNKQFTIQHVLGDGELVAVHSHIVMKAGEAGYSTLHLFRFSGDKIVELWDIGQPVPAASPNEDGAF